jgi:gliding motility-associated-like protein
MKNILLTFLMCMAAAFTLRAQTPCTGLPVVTITASNTAPCDGEEITLTASGASTYMWNNNVTNGVAFTPSASETYRVLSTDTAGCVDTSTVAIQVLELPNVSANSSSLSICLGDSIELTASGADSYNWIEPSIVNGSFYQPTETGANIFNVEGTGSNGCLNTSQVIVVVKAVPDAPSLSTPRIETCVNVAFEEQIEVTSTTGRPIWYRDAALQEEYSAEPLLTIPNNTVGVQTYYASTFDGGCYSETSMATVEVYARPIISAGADIRLNAAENGALKGEATTAAMVEWSPETGLDNPFVLDPGFTATNSQVYTLTVEDDNGCVSTDKMTVDVENGLTISNAMTPNGDGDNDVWKIYPELVLETCNVRLFDGFGRLLLETDAYQNDWDGTFEGNALPDGDYYYHVQCDDIDTKGTLIIIK